ncbi:hypothetical protein [Streptomyces sp. NPDC002082]|uniref:hypothetical protein n=1 Tax=Streptomyces sp. NPDC002082 TaxID=3154772 RepID=UPI0033301891
MAAGAAAEAAEMVAAASPAQRRAWAEREEREKKRLAEVKRRLSDSWQDEVVPQLEEYAEFMKHRGFSRTGMAEYLVRAGEASRAKAFKLLAIAEEIGLIPTRDGLSPFYELPRWNQWALESGR